MTIVRSNVQGGLGFFLNPSPESFRLLPKHDTFLDITEDEVRYIHINQEIIQKGMLWVEDDTLRIEFGIDSVDGQRENMNAIKRSEIVELVSGNYKKLEKALQSIDEQSILTQFVEVARELKIDSKTKIDVIERAAKINIYEEE